MKIRTGFVSNSSSSSFVCDVSGDEVTGFDMDLSEAGMYACINKHCFNEEYLIGELPDDNDRYDIPEENCSICSFNYIMEDQIVIYIQKFYSITSSQVFGYMKAKNKRLRKMRNVYYFEFIEKEKNITKSKLVEEIKSKYSSLEEFEEALV